MSEIEEDRLWNGRKYVSFPDGYDQTQADGSNVAVQGTMAREPGEGMVTSREREQVVSESQNQVETEEQRLIRLRMKQQEEHQQIEAQNR